MTKERKNLPGDRQLNQEIQRMIRVNQAGEQGAVSIYKGQLAVLGRTEVSPLLEHMLEQEKEHLDKFSRLLSARKVRPTVLSPVWSILGFAMGAGTALMGRKAAMACTVAVEEVIDEHYAAQEHTLRHDQDPELRHLITKCREEENEHKEAGLSHGAEQAFAYPILSSVIKKSSKLAIWLSTRI
ncbi:MAG: demethoxyubiquinone hydroxylase family protein [Alphaproteobacteria bacterium]|nr:demethoxyubiquinone hydroxylase family protein [Alphaproteobacteria bacterium]